MGWVEDNNIHLDTRWTGGSEEATRRTVSELLGFRPNLVIATGASTVAALMRANRTTPIVFVQVIDPVGAGFVESLARPGGNATGFVQFEYGLSSKWLELLKEIAPELARAAILRDPTIGSGTAQLAAIQAVAPLFRMELHPMGVSDADQITRDMQKFAQRRAGGVIVTVGPKAILHRALIIRLAAEHRLPAVYPARFYAIAGGLISYGPNSIEPYRRAAEYADRILKGERPGDLPVQAPTAYELVINRKTAQALGVDVPGKLIARADEVME